MAGCRLSVQSSGGRGLAGKVISRSDPLGAVHCLPGAPCEIKYTDFRLGDWFHVYCEIYFIIFWWLGIEALTGNGLKKIVIHTGFPGIADVVR